MRRMVGLVTVLLLGVESPVMPARAPARPALAWAQTPPPAVVPPATAADPAAGLAGATVGTPYAEAASLFDVLRPDLLPPELGESRGREEQWPSWVAQRGAEIRQRLLPGSEDAIVNLLFFGTRFTTRPRVRSAEIPGLDARAVEGDVIQGRIDDFIAALQSPGSDGRLRFATEVIGSQGLDVSTAPGRSRVRAYILRLIDRVVSDQRSYDDVRASLKTFNDPAVGLIGRSTMFRERGLSSDTSLFPNFAVEEALRDIRAVGLIGRDAVRRVAVIGPGLDVSDKEEGYDFYPQQSIQPFALLDSLLRVELADERRVQLVAMDVNPRITQHLAAARLRALAGTDYVIQLPRNPEETWNPRLAHYWEMSGTMVGRRIAADVPPSNTGTIDVRATRIRPEMVLRVFPQDVNIVVQRAGPLAPGERYDLIVATNMLIYYSAFEQALALTNIASMLRPGGLFLTNDFVLPVGAMVVAGYTDVPFTDAGDGDRIWWYERR